MLVYSRRTNRYLRQAHAPCHLQASVLPDLSRKAAETLVGRSVHRFVETLEMNKG
jgi:hypothetical protein